ncbi:MAG: chemotaxis protein CheX [Deltaproteobacteria bacterium]|nr:chemotaxis protein CheX [Candidatus Anaeroferrophillus wilburensis]MBN2889770.1 chemotaxis protein CheX [Deltaproteobacteria bacterium]
MAFVTSTPGKPFVKKDQTATGDITGIIGLSGDREGSLSISFSFSCIKGILENMLGEIHDELNEEVNDAVGELTNMICGQARNKLESVNINLKAGIPTIIAGTNHTVRHITSSPIIVLPFVTDYGGFSVEFSFLE